MSEQHGSFSSTSSVSIQTPSAFSPSPFPGAHCHQPGGGGMKLEAVMENLQRQQTARLALEKKLRQAEAKEDLRCMMESQIHQQAVAFSHYQTAVRGALNAGVGDSLSRVTLPHVTVRHSDEDGNSSRAGHEGTEQVVEEDMNEPGSVNEEEEEEEDDTGFSQHRQPSLQGSRAPPHGSPMFVMSRVPAPGAAARRAESPPAHPQSQHHEWTYEEQFKQVRFSVNHSAASPTRYYDIYIYHSELNIMCTICVK